MTYEETAVELIWGRFGYWLTATMFVLFLVRRQA